MLSWLHLSCLLRLLLIYNAILRHRSKENSLGLVQLPGDILLILIFASEDFLKEGHSISHSARILLIALSSRKFAEPDLIPGEVVLRKSDGPVELLYIRWRSKFEIGINFLGHQLVYLGSPNRVTVCGILAPSLFAMEKFIISILVTFISSGAYLILVF